MFCQRLNMFLKSSYVIVNRKSCFSYDSSIPIKLAEEFLIYTHHITGFEWYSSLFVSTLLLRFSVGLPISLLQIKNLQRLAVINKEMSDIVPYVKKNITIEAKQLNIPFDKAQQNYNKKIYELLNSLYIRDNCHPAKNYIYPLVQLPLWISISLALRFMTMESKNPMLSNLEDGGMLTFTNLCLPDQYFTLPCFLLLTNLISSELMYGKLSGIKTDINPSNRITIFKWITRCSAFLLFYISSIVPSALSLYWLYSATLGLAQNQLIRRIIKSKIS